jgi:hypothetical protein
MSPIMHAKSSSSCCEGAEALNITCACCCCLLPCRHRDTQTLFASADAANPFAIPADEDLFRLQVCADGGHTGSMGLSRCCPHSAQCNCCDVATHLYLSVCVINSGRKCTCAPRWKPFCTGSSVVA